MGRRVGGRYYCCDAVESKVTAVWLMVVGLLCLCNTAQQSGGDHLKTTSTKRRSNANVVMTTGEHL